MPLKLAAAFVRWTDGCSGYRREHVRSCYVRARASRAPEAGGGDHQARGRHRFDSGLFLFPSRKKNAWVLSNPTFLHFTFYGSSLYRLCSQENRFQERESLENMGEN